VQIRHFRVVTPKRICPPSTSSSSPPPRKPTHTP